MPARTAPPTDSVAHRVKIPSRGRLALRPFGGGPLSAIRFTSEAELHAWADRHDADVIERAGGLFVTGAGLVFQVEVVS